MGGINWDLLNLSLDWPLRRTVNWIAEYKQKKQQRVWQLFSGVCPPRMYPGFDDFKWLKKFPGQTSFHIKQGIARTQSPTNKNYAAKFPTFGEIVGVNRPAVQWNSLVLGELPPWSQLAPQPGKYALPRSAPQSITLFPICPAQFCPLWTICYLPFCFSKLNDNMTSLWMKRKH